MSLLFQILNSMLGFGGCILDTSTSLGGTRFDGRSYLGSRRRKNRSCIRSECLNIGFQTLELVSKLGCSWGVGCSLLLLVRLLRMSPPGWFRNCGRCRIRFGDRGGEDGCTVCGSCCRGTKYDLGHQPAASPDTARTQIQPLLCLQTLSAINTTPAGKLICRSAGFPSKGYIASNFILLNVVVVIAIVGVVGVVVLLKVDVAVFQVMECPIHVSNWFSAHLVGHKNDAFHM